MAGLPSRTFYEVLGITREADQHAIKTAYRKMCRRCHPDKNPANEQAVMMQQEVNLAYETLYDAILRRKYDAKLQSQHRALEPFTSQSRWDSFDGASEIPSFDYRQRSGCGFHYWQRAEDDYFWNEKEPQSEMPPYFWDYENVCKRYEEEVKRKEQARKVEKERKAKAEADKRKDRYRLCQQELVERIVALDEDIARLEDASPISAFIHQEIDDEGGDTVNHLSIKLKSRRKDLSESLCLYKYYYDLQIEGGRMQEADEAASNLVKARQELAVKLKEDHLRTIQQQTAAHPSRREGSYRATNPRKFPHDTIKGVSRTIADPFTIWGPINTDRERVLSADHSQSEELHEKDLRHQSDQEELRKLQEHYNTNKTASGNRERNEATFENAGKEGERPEEQSEPDLLAKLQRQAAQEGKTDATQGRSKRVDDWLNQLFESLEFDTRDEQSSPSTSYPDMHPPSPQAVPVSVDAEAEPVIPDLTPTSPPPRSSPTLVESEPEQLISGMTTEPSEPDTRQITHNYLETVHNPHLEVHGEFWDFNSTDELDCDFCGMIRPVLQCPNCDARACSDCKTRRGFRRSYAEASGWQ